VDLIDLEKNKFCSLPVTSVLSPDYEGIRLFTQLEQDGYLQSLHGSLKVSDIPGLIFTFEEFLKRTTFVSRMRKILNLLEWNYRAPVDMEFTARLRGGQENTQDVEITIVQCRPQSRLIESKQVRIPINLEQEDIAFMTWFMVPRGYIQRVRYIIYVPADEYFKLDTVQARNDVGRTVGKINLRLKNENFICVGPGRWGTSNPDLGIYVNYSDIYNAKALVEITGKGRGAVPEPSLGTHFFQDLLEAQIYPLAVNLDDERTYLNTAMFNESPNRLSDINEPNIPLNSCVRLIDVADYRPGSHLEISMDDEKSQAVAYLKPDD